LHHAGYGTYFYTVLLVMGCAMLLAGKVAVIFGGSGAIGCAVAQVMAREGAHVFLGARSQQNLNQAASRIRASGGSADTFIIDVLDEQSTAEQVMQCKQGLIPGKYSPQKRSQWG
jgi:NADP-dependent 3-hydroxy acid dehydrogenase YdfG